MTLRPWLSPLLIAVISCGGSSSSTSSHTFIASSTSVMPLQIVELADASANFKQTSYAGTMGSTAVTLGRETSTTLVLVVPATAAGPVVLHVAGYADVTFSVAAAPTVADPVTAVHTQLSTLTANLQSDATTYSGRPDLAPFYSAALANVTAVQAKFDALDSTSQMQVAVFLAVNASLTANSFWSTLTSMQVLNDVGRVARDVAVMALGVALAPETGGLSVLVVEAGEVAFLTDVRQAMSDYAQATQDDAIPAPTDPVTDAVVPLTFTNNSATTFPLSIELDNLSSRDAANPSSTVAPVVDAFAQLKDQWPTANQILPTSLGDGPDLTTVMPTDETHPIDATDGAIGMVTGNVTLVDSTLGNGSGTATFTSPECAGSTSAVTFSFTVTYTSAPFAPQILTIPATLSCGPCGDYGEACCANSMCPGTVLNAVKEPSSLSCGTAGNVAGTCCVASGQVASPGSICCSGAMTMMPYGPEGEQEPYCV